MDVYQPSGKWSPRLLLTTVFAGVVMAACAEAGVALFAYLPHWSVAVVSLAGNALITWMAASMAASKGRCRNTTIGALAGAAVALAGVLGGHAWSYRRAVELVARGEMTPPGPAGYVDSFAWRSERGYATVARSTAGSVPAGRLRGIPVLLAWAVEALLLAAVGRAAGRSGATEPYCEACDAPTQRAFVHVPSTPERVAEAGAASDARALTAVEAAAAEGGPTLIYTLDHCPRCHRGWLSVSAKHADGSRSMLHREVTLGPEAAGPLRAALQAAKEKKRG